MVILLVYWTELTLRSFDAATSNGSDPSPRCAGTSSRSAWSGRCGGGGVDNARLFDAMLDVGDVDADTPRDQHGAESSRDEYGAEAVAEDGVIVGADNARDVLRAVENSQWPPESIAGFDAEPGVLATKVTVMICQELGEAPRRLVHVNHVLRESIPPLG